jgi:hypothetical protein
MIMILLFFLLLVFLFLFFYFVVRMMFKYKLKKKYMIIILLSVCSISYFYYAKTRYTYVIPFIHFLFEPDDYYDPLIKDEFMFDEKGYSKTYLLPYKYPQKYAIKILRGENKPSKINGLTGKLKAEFFYENKLLFEKYSARLDVSFTDTVIELIEFTMPLNNKYKSSTSVRLTVLEPFKELEEFDEPLLIKIGVISP